MYDLDTIIKINNKAAKDALPRGLKDHLSFRVRTYGGKITARGKRSGAKAYAAIPRACDVTDKLTNLVFARKSDGLLVFAFDQDAANKNTERN